MPNNKVLIPINQSELSQEILPYVEKFFPSADNEVVLFFVTRPPTGAGFGEPDLGAGYTPRPGDKQVQPTTLHPIYESQQEDSIRSHVEAELASVTDRLEDAGYKVSLVVGFDKDPIDAILSEIRKSKIDLVAMSTRARVGVTRFFFRNIADTLAKKAKIPVLLAHPQKA
jgi:nucleotide-binding universal stress UspA family protein